MQYMHLNLQLLLRCQGFPLLSGNLAAIITVLYCSIMSLDSPFAPVHLLLINLLTDSLPALAIGMEPTDKTLLKNKPRDQM